MPGAKFNSIKRPNVYEALRKRGHSKEKAAKIANSRDSKAMFDALTTTREVPREVKSMPAEVQKVWTIAFTRALTEDPEAMAADLAMSKVKQLFQQKGDTWIAKKGNEYNPATDPESEEYDPALDPDSPEYDPEAAAAAEEEGEIDPETGEPVDPIMADPYADPDDPDAALMADPYAEENGEAAQEEAEMEPEGEEEEVDPAMQAESEAAQAEELAAMTRARAKYRSKYAAKMSSGDSGEFTDTFTLDAKGFRITGDGYLVANPRVARTGIQLYKGFEVGKPHMDVVRVYRPEKEVFKNAAMTSLAHHPITLGHPATQVDASNWRSLSVGKSDGDVARDGDFVRVPLVLMDANAISEVQRGTSQLSVGYGATLKWGQGQAPDGQMYDAMQTEIRANHIALVSAARGGDKLRIGDTKSEKRKGKHNDHQRSKAMTERTLDGVTIELEDKDGQILDRHLATLNKTIRDQGTDVEAIKAQIAELQAQLAAANKGIGAKDGEIAALKQEVTDAKVTPDFIDKAINIRMDIVDRAMIYFGDGKYQWQGKADAQIRRDVVSARLGDAKAKLMSDENIEGAFLSITEPEHQDGFRQMTQSFSKAPVGATYNDAAAKAYDKRSLELASRWQKTKLKSQTV